MSKIVGFIIETDEIQKGDLFTDPDILKPNGDFYFVMFNVSLEDKRRLATYQKPFLKAVFHEKFVTELKAKKGIKKAGLLNLYCKC